jgi:hypothetical protein
MLLTEEQALVRDTMRAFARDELAPHAAAWDREHTFPREALHALGALGALGMVVPERWGGAAMDYVSLAITLEEIAAGRRRDVDDRQRAELGRLRPAQCVRTDAQKEEVSEAVGARRAVRAVSA